MHVQDIIASGDRLKLPMAKTGIKKVELSVTPEGK